MAPGVDNVLEEMHNVQRLQDFEGLHLLEVECSIIPCNLVPGGRGLRSSGVDFPLSLISSSLHFIHSLQLPGVVYLVDFEVPCYILSPN